MGALSSIGVRDAAHTRTRYGVHRKRVKPADELTRVRVVDERAGGARHTGARGLNGNLIIRRRELWRAPTVLFAFQISLFVFSSSHSN